MNLYLRLLFTLLFARFKSKQPMLAESFTSHRVLPNDLDIFGHMNNGRYFTIADCARVEKMIRSGVWKVLRSKGYYPLMAGETVQFRRSLAPFQKYKISNKTLGWDDKFFYVEHKFLAKGSVYALMIVKVRFVSKDKVKVSPAELLRMFEDDVAEQNMNNVLKTWNNCSDSHWELESS